jgi:hypothetical protein
MTVGSAAPRSAIRPHQPRCLRALTERQERPNPHDGGFWSKARVWVTSIEGVEQRHAFACTTRSQRGARAV